MGIYIKGMELPTCCDDCFALDDHGDYPYCLISHDQRGYTFRTDIRTMPSCPLIEVPTPHGRLIDADDLNELIACGDDLDFDEVPETKIELMRMIYDAPTIIEAGGIEDG